MKIAIICDSHFGVRNDNPVLMENAQKSLEWFFTHVQENNINTVLHLGDLFDRRKYVNFKTALFARKNFLERLQSLSINTHIITGNHDLYYKDTHEVNSLFEIVGDRYSNIKIYDRPVKLEFDGTEIQLMPWITDSNADESYDAIKNTTAEILMGHLEIKGFELMKGRICDHGDDINLYDRFDLVFSGHFHKKSSISNIHYLGAFGEYTWSDYNEARGFTIFDTATREFELIKNPYVLHKVVNYDDETGQSITFDNDEYKDTFVKVICGKRDNLYAFDMFIDRLYKTTPSDIIVVEDMSQVLQDENMEEIGEAQDTPSILRSYIQSLTFPVESAIVVDYMDALYQEAASTKFTD